MENVSENALQFHSCAHAVGFKLQQCIIWTSNHGLSQLVAPRTRICPKALMFHVSLLMIQMHNIQFGAPKCFLTFYAKVGVSKLMAC